MPTEHNHHSTTFKKLYKKIKVTFSSTKISAKDITDSKIQCKILITNLEELSKKVNKLQETALDSQKYIQSNILFSNKIKKTIAQITEINGKMAEAKKNIENYKNNSPRLLKYITNPLKTQNMNPLMNYQKKCQN